MNNNEKLIGFTRKFAIEHLTGFDKDEKDWDDEYELKDYNSFSNEQLADELMGIGSIHDGHMAGVFDVLPEGVLDAEVVIPVTGVPPSPEAYFYLKN